MIIMCCFWLLESLCGYDLFFCCGRLMMLSSLCMCFLCVFLFF